MKSKDDGLNAYYPTTNYSFYSAFDRNFKNNNTVKPSLSCINQNDKLTEVKLGNKLGLLTADESTLAGSGWNGYNSSSYLNIGVDAWLFSPFWWGGDGAEAFSVHSDGQLHDSGVNWSSYGVRASISLSSSSMVMAGDGTIETPWLVQ